MTTVLSDPWRRGVLVVIVQRDDEQTGAATPEADRIVADVLAGHTPAFAALVRLYQESVWRIAAALLRDRDATENIVQQVFVDAYFHLDQYALGTDFGAWIRTVARNRLRKELRTAGREDRRLAVYRERLAERLRAESAAHRDDSDAYVVALRGCRELLTPREAAVLALRYERGLSFEAIASKQGQTPEAVQRMISRIRCRLRDCIQTKLNDQ
ncbi:sigma-70 family RNA polymerase sigma factor [Gemmata sp. JC717]|uniref:sigma-70 family RNA polymerase sigma factor n=1 Tax=Gemmata algarum TaxID=2975278 RepID=UPI0021BA8C4A|nr:sigma-70 family RNA polymerase sigma factor [Gemmata algarum]MDY3552816.1 sigma-70 family RNA polymerase sigma factor [Gemmata algarum]